MTGPDPQPVDGPGVDSSDSEAVDPDPPYYDERGNVRPRGAEGARFMTLAERKAIARQLADGGDIVTTAEKTTRTRGRSTKR